MDFTELSESRYSVRKFKDRPVSKEHMQIILRAAQLAPTGCNYQPQRIYVAESEEAIGRLNEISRCIFGAKTVKTKRKYKERVAQLRIQMVDELKRLRAVSNEDHLMLLDWDMFDQNKAAKFFDSNWMFGIDGGFNIVIGNPPYGVSIKGEYRKEVVRCLGNVPDYEIYYYFIQAGRNLLLENGTICYIVPNTWLFNTYARRFRETVLEKWNVIEILDCTKFKIFDATVLNSIITWQKSSLAVKRETVGYRKTAGSNSFEELVSVPREQMNKRDLLLMNQNWGLAFSSDNLTVGIVNRITQLGITIETVFPEISQGLIAYDKYRGQSDKIIKSRAYHSFEYRKGWKKWLWGEDVKRFVLSWNGQEYIDYCTGIKKVCLVVEWTRIY